MPQIYMCRCDFPGCSAEERVTQFSTPPGWVRRTVNDSIAATGLGESDFGSQEIYLYCIEHVATLVPPLAPAVAREQQRRAAGVAVGVVVPPLYPVEPAQLLPAVERPRDEKDGK